MVEIKVKEFLEILRGYPHQILVGDLGELKGIEVLKLIDLEEAQTITSKELREELAQRGLIIVNKPVKLKVYPKVLILDLGVSPHYSEVLQEISLVLALKGVKELLRELLESAYNPPWLSYKGVDPKAHLGENVQIGEDVWIGPYVVVMENVKIGDGVKIFPFTYIGSNVEIGKNSVIFPGAVIMDDVKLGENVRVLPGAVIGADGFGFIRRDEGWIRLPHLGGVEIGDDVEIGANSTVDKGTLKNTKVGRGTKVDNLAHIGHNCVVGENVMIIAQVGIGGSTKVGDNAILAGQSGVKDNINIGENAQIGGGSVVVKDVPPGAKYWGFPAISHSKWVRMMKWLEDKVERRMS